MRNLLIASTTLLVLAACSPTHPPTPAPTVIVPTPAVAAPTVAQPAAQAAQPAQPAQAPTAAPAAAPANAGPVSLQVLSPQDGSVVNTAQVAVSGVASPGAVVTVNDDILIAGGNGQFQDTVALSEGLNLIEVIASNTSGSEASAEITVTYQP